jgi:hypothetical protein
VPIERIEGESIPDQEFNALALESGNSLFELKIAIECGVTANSIDVGEDGEISLIAKEQLWWEKRYAD